MKILMLLISDVPVTPVIINTLLSNKEFSKYVSMMKHACNCNIHNYNKTECCACSCLIIVSVCVSDSMK